MKLDAQGMLYVNYIEENYPKRNDKMEDDPIVIEFRKKYASSPRAVSKNDKRIRFKLPEATWFYLDYIAKQYKTTRPEMIREWLDVFDKKRYDLSNAPIVDRKGTRPYNLQVPTTSYTVIKEKIEKYDLPQIEIANRIVCKNIIDYKKSIMTE